MRISQKTAVLVVVFNAAFFFYLADAPKAEENALSSSTTKSLSSPSEDALLVKATRPKPFGEGPFKIFNVYTDAGSKENHYSPTGMMGDTWDIAIDERSAMRPHGGSTCIKVVYSKKASLGARWAGVYWQDPNSNWGAIPGGYNLTGAKRLTFWARGEKGDEKIAQFKVGGMSAQYGDSDSSAISGEILSTNWQKFSIDLEGKDLSVITGGFCFTVNLDSNPEGVTFYLDDIQFE